MPAKTISFKMIRETEIMYNNVHLGMTYELDEKENAIDAFLGVKKQLDEAYYSLYPNMLKFEQEVAKKAALGKFSVLPELVIWSKMFDRVVSGLKSKRHTIDEVKSMFEVSDEVLIEIKKQLEI